MQNILKQSITPRFGQLLCMKLNGKVVVEGLDTPLPDVVFDRLDARIKAGLRLIPKPLAYLIRRAMGKLDLTRPWVVVVDLEVKVEQQRDPSCKLVYRDLARVGPDVELLTMLHHVTVDELQQHEEDILNEAEAADLGTIPIHDGLPSLKHEVDHD